MAHVYHVVSLFSLVRWLLIRISATTSDMGEACSLSIKRRDEDAIMVDLRILG
jgi:hypothetical protein